MQEVILCRSAVVCEVIFFYLLFRLTSFSPMKLQTETRLWTTFSVPTNPPKRSKLCTAQNVTSLLQWFTAIKKHCRNGGCVTHFPVSGWPLLCWDPPRFEQTVHCHCTVGSMSNWNESNQINVEPFQIEFNLLAHRTFQPSFLDDMELFLHLLHPCLSAFIGVCSSPSSKRFRHSASSLFRLPSASTPTVDLSVNIPKRKEQIVSGAFSAVVCVAFFSLFHSYFPFFLFPSWDRTFRPKFRIQSNHGRTVSHRGWTLHDRGRTCPTPLTVFRGQKVRPFQDMNEELRAGVNDLQ